MTFHCDFVLYIQGCIFYVSSCCVLCCTHLRWLCWNFFFLHQCHVSFLWLVLLLYWNCLLDWLPLYRAIFYSTWHPAVFWVHDPFVALPWPCLQLGVHCSWSSFPLQLWLLLLGGFIYLPFCHVLWVSRLYIFSVHFFFGILYRLIPCYTMYTPYVSQTFLSRVMVRGDKMQILPSKASPLPSSCSLWCSRETYFWPSILLQIDPCGSLDTRMEVYHFFFML